MIREFRLPDIGEGLTEAEIVSWMVAEGDQVELDQPVVEIETDKALMEIPTPFAGVLVAHGAPEGTVLNVGAVLLTIETDEADDNDGLHKSESRHAWNDGAEAAPIVGTLSSEAVDLTPRTHATQSAVTSGPEVLPIVRKLARELEVDISTIAGTGAGGKVTRDDVRAAATGGRPPTIYDAVSTTDAHVEDETIAADIAQHSQDVEDEQHIGPDDPPQNAEGRTRPLSKMRRTIAERMSKSWNEIPHVTTFGSADVTRLMASRTALKTRRQAPVSIDAMVVKAVATALDQHREMAARLIDEAAIEFPERVDIGVAVDTDDGLMVVVVEEPGALDLVALTAELARLAGGARDRTLSAGSFTGQSFTVSNIGAVGGGYGTPIIPHGTTAILSVGKAEDTPVARDGRIQLARMMPLSLSYDHRLIDGAAGRRFLATVIENLEEPTLFLA